MQQFWFAYFILGLLLSFFSPLSHDTEDYRFVSNPPVKPANNEFTSCVTTYLSDLNWVGTPITDNGEVEKDQSIGGWDLNDGNLMTIGTSTHPKGIGVHAYSEVIYNLAGQYDTFSAFLGIDEECDYAGSVVFELYFNGNSTPAFTSPLLTYEDDQYLLEISVEGVNELKLVVTDGGDGNACDHADWADAKLEACSNVCTPGTACDDGDPCTSGEVYDANCNCGGGNPVADDDNDGICNTIDICPGFDDSLDSDSDGIPDGCDTGNDGCVTTYLSDLNWVGTPITDNGEVEKDQSIGGWDLNDGNLMTIGTSTHPKGIGVHAYSEVIYNLAGQYDTFSAFLGIDEECDYAGSVVFELYFNGNSTPAFTSPLLTYEDDEYLLEISVAGVNELKLVVTDGGDGNACDHADWADAKLEACSSGCTPGTACDDGDPCTTGETLDANCNCTGGTPVADDDNDGVCNAVDACPDHNDNLDSDADGIPDGCELSPPACQATYLSDLNWLSENNPLETIHLNQSVANNPLTIGGQVFTSGLGVHAPSEIVYDLDGQYQTFNASVGLDDGVDSCGDPAVEFIVFADGVQVFSSGVLEKTDAAVAVSVDVTGVEELKLVVTDGGNDIGCDHADWADAKLEVCDPITSDCYIDNSYNSGVKQLLYPSDIIFIGFDNDIGEGRDRIMLTNLAPLRTGTEFSITNANYCADTEAWYSQDNQDGNISAQTLTYVGESALPAGSIICVEIPATGEGNDLLLENILLNGSPTTVFSVNNGGHALNPDINLLSDQGSGLFLMQGNWKYSPSKATFTGRMISALRIGDTDAWTSGSCGTDSELPEELACLEGPSFADGGSYFGYFDCSQFGSTFSRSGYLAAASTTGNWTHGAGTSAQDLGVASCTTPCFITCEELYWSVEPGTLTVSCGTDYQTIIQDWLGRNGDGQYISSCAGTLEISHNYEGTNISFACTPKRMPVTFTAKDQCGNMASVDGYIIVEDIGTPQFTTQPSNSTISCIGQAAVLDAFQAWIDSNGGAIAEDNCGGVQVYSNPAELEFSGCNATAEVTFYAMGTCGTVVSMVATFTVIDDVAPNITVQPSNKTLNCNDPNFTALRDDWLNRIGETGQAIDDCSGGLIKWTHTPVAEIANCGTNIIEFVATDPCGNSSFAYATLIIIDDVGPKITKAPKDIVLFTTTENFIDEINNWLQSNGNGGIARDMCSGEQVTWSNNYFDNPLTQSTCGSLIVTFTVTDACGNTNDTTAMLRVEDKTIPYFIDLPKNDTISCDTVDFQDPWDDWLATYGGATAGDSVGTLTWSYEIIDPVQSRCGKYEVVFTVSDECGLQISAGALFVVEDDTPPVIDPQQPPQPLNLDTLNPNQIYDWLLAGGYGSVSDNCDDAIYWTNDLELPLPDETCYEIPVIFTASDGCNEVSAQTTLRVGPYNSPPPIDLNYQDGVLYAIFQGCSNPSLAWFKNGQPYAAGPGDPDFSITPDGSATYRVEVSDCWACGTMEASSEIDICDALSVSITEDANGDLCANVSGCFHSDVIYYTWSNGARDACITPSLANVDQTFTVQVSCGSCTAVSAEYVHQTPCPDPMIFMSYDNTYWPSIHAETEACAAPIYNWYQDDVYQYSQNPNINGFSYYLPSEAGIYKVVVDNCAGCAPFEQELDLCPIILDEGEDLELYCECTGSFNSTKLATWLDDFGGIRMDFCGNPTVTYEHPPISSFNLSSCTNSWTVPFKVYEDGLLVATINRQLSLIPQPAGCNSITFHQFPIELECGSLSSSQISGWIEDLRESLVNQHCSEVIWDPWSPGIKTAIENCQTQTVTFSGLNQCETFEVTRTINVVCSELSVTIQNIGGDLCANVIGCGGNETLSYQWTGGGNTQCITPSGNLNDYSVTVTCTEADGTICDTGTASYDNSDPCDYLDLEIISNCAEQKYDILFLLDVSSSISSSEFNAMSSSIENTIANLEANSSQSDQILYSVVLYDQGPFTPNGYDRGTLWQTIWEDGSQTINVSRPHSSCAGLDEALGDLLTELGSTPYTPRAEADLHIVIFTDAEASASCSNLTPDTNARNLENQYNATISVVRYPTDFAGNNAAAHVAAQALVSSNGIYQNNDNFGEALDLVESLVICSELTAIVPIDCTNPTYSWTWTAGGGYYASTESTVDYYNNGVYQLTIYCDNHQCDITATYPDNAALVRIQAAQERTQQVQWNYLHANNRNPEKELEGVLPIPSQQSEQLRFYPNPTRRKVTLEYRSLHKQQLRLELYAPSGQQVLTHRPEVIAGDNTWSYDIRHLAAGVYILKVYTDTEVYIEKLISQN